MKSKSSRAGFPEIFRETIYRITAKKFLSFRLENWAEFEKIRAAAPNQKVRRCCERLFGSLANAKPYLEFAWQQQALLQVCQDFCLEDLSDCIECSFPEQLAQWKSTDD